MKEREERKRFKLNGRFQNWKQIPEVLSKDQGFYYMHEGCILQTGFQRFLMCPFIKGMGENLLQKHADEPLKYSTKVLKHSVKLLKHSANFWRFKRKLKAWPRVWKAMQNICITTRPMLSKSVTVIGLSCLRGCYVSFYFEKTMFFNNWCLFNLS